MSNLTHLESLSKRLEFAYPQQPEEAPKPSLLGRIGRVAAGVAGAGLAYGAGSLLRGRLRNPNLGWQNQLKVGHAANVSDAKGLLSKAKGFFGKSAPVSPGPGFVPNVAPGERFPLALRNVTPSAVAPSAPAPVTPPPTRPVSGGDNFNYGVPPNARGSYMRPATSGWDPVKGLVKTPARVEYYAARLEKLVEFATGEKKSKGKLAPKFGKGKEKELASKKVKSCAARLDALVEFASSNAGPARPSPFTNMPSPRQIWSEEKGDADYKLVRTSRLTAGSRLGALAGVAGGVLGGRALAKFNGGAGLSTSGQVAAGVLGMTVGSGIGGAIGSRIRDKNPPRKDPGEQAIYRIVA